MITIRRNVFETNSSSTHSVTITDSTLMPSEFEIKRDWDICDGEPYISVDLVGFCSFPVDSQNDKLAYLVEQIAYLTGNYLALGWYGSKEENEAARQALYDTEEFKELESAICDYAGCKHIRINTATEGYIDHDSVVADMNELLQYDVPYQGLAALVFGKDTYVYFEFCGQ